MLKNLKKVLNWSIAILIIVIIGFVFLKFIIPNALTIFLTLKIIGIIFVGICTIGYLVFIFIISNINK